MQLRDTLPPRRVSRRGNRHTAKGALDLCLLGPLRVLRAGETVTLPASRKARALLGYLALAPRPVARSTLCELLWEAPEQSRDPRGELRWCLSRLRAAIDDPQHPRLVARGDTIALDLDGCRVDALELSQAAQSGVEHLALEQQRALAERVGGDLLEGLELDDGPAFDAWLTAQRRRLRGCHVAVLEQLATRLPPAEARRPLEAWLALAPFDRRVHQRLLDTLAHSGQMREAEEHLRSASALFEAEGLDARSLHETWQAARTAAAQPLTARAEPEARPVPRRASIAVMPFLNESTGAGARGGPADALAHDITTRLAKLRSLFVIAQGSTFALHERRIGPEEAGRMLDVDYVLGGTLRQYERRLRIHVELSETRTARIVWSEMLNPSLGDAFSALDEIGNRIVASVAGEIETLERNRAILRPPATLDAWEAHHRGLWHMYRFTPADNERALHFFATAIRLDPTFSRAHAGLSFAHFQNAFQRWSDPAAATGHAYAAAGQALLADDRDPAAHWSMGRALWLRGAHEQAVGELRQSVELAPNFAPGHYALAFVQSQSGDAARALSCADTSLALSPFDPLLFGVLGSRAMALARLGQYEQAAEEAVRAAARPNAHPHIAAIAAFTLALAGKLDAARTHAAALRRLRPDYSAADFLATFRFDDAGAALFKKAAGRLGMA